MKVAIGIVTVLDQKLFIIFTLLSTGFKNSTVADARTDVIAESDRRVDDARVGGHRLCRWRRLIHDGTAEMSGGGSSWSRCGLLFGVGEKKKQVRHGYDISYPKKGRQTR